MAVYVLTIAGVQHDVLLSSFSIKQAASGVHVLTIDVDSEDASIRHNLDDEVILTEDATRIYGGYVVGWSERALAGEAATGIVRTLTCNDFNGLAQRRYVNATIPAGTTKAGLQLLMALLDLTAQYGITLSGSQVDGVMLPELTYRWVRFDDVLKDLSTRNLNSGTPLLPEISYTKVLSLFDPASRTASALTEVDGSYETAQQLGDVVVEAARDENSGVNRVIVKGQDIKADAWVDTFVGDGVTDTFPLSLTYEYGYGFVAVDGVNEGFNAVPTENPAGGSEWDLIGANSIKRVAGAPANGASVYIMYKGSGSPYAMAEDVSLQVSPRGIWEMVVLSDAVFSNAAALDLAESLLEQAKRSLTRKTTYTTPDRDIFPGDSLTINLPKRAVNSNFILNDIEVHNEPGSEQILRRVTAIEGSYARNPMQIYKDWLSGSGGGGGVSASAVSPMSPIGTILLATLTLTNAQIKALPTTPLTVVAVPSANYRLVPIKAEINTQFAAAYTNIDPSAVLGVTFQGGGSPSVLGGKAFRYVVGSAFLGSPIGSPSASLLLDDLLDEGARLAQLTPYTEDGPLPSIELIENIENLPIVVGIDNAGAGDLTGGNTGNAMRVAVWYAVMPNLLAPLVSITIPAGSLAFSGAEGAWVFLAPDGTRLPDPDAAPTNVAVGATITGGLVALDSGEFFEVDQGAVTAYVYDPDLTLRGSVALAAAGQGSASNFSDGFFVLDGTDIKRIDLSPAVIQTWVGVGGYDAIGVSPDSATAYLAANNADHIDAYDLAGSTGPTTFATETGWGHPFGGSMLSVLRNGNVVAGWYQNSDNTQYVKVYDPAGATLHTFAIGVANDFLVAISLEADDLSFWVSYWVNASSVARVSNIRISDGAVLHTFDKTSGTLPIDNAVFAVVREGI